MSSCLCTGACMKPGGSCIAWPKGRNMAVTSTEFCYCDCHKPRVSTVPPICTCQCWQSGIGQSIQPVINPYMETMSLCKHGVPSKHYCGYCASESCRQEEKVEELKLSAVRPKSDVEILLERIEKLEKYDESFKVAALEEVNNSIAEYKMLNERFDKLESKVKENELRNMKRIEENTLISRRLTELETGLDLVRALGSRPFHSHEKKPHKCPVCSGDGTMSKAYNAGEDIKMDGINIHRGDDILVKDVFCRACEGKGVLWG